MDGEEVIYYDTTIPKSAMIQKAIPLFADAVSTEGGEIYLRKPEDEQYLLWSAGKVRTETALNFIGYPNVEVFLEDLNKEESQTEDESVEDEDEME